MSLVKGIINLILTFIFVITTPVSLVASSPSASVQDKTKPKKTKKNMFESNHDSMYTVGAATKLIRSGEFTRAFVLLKKILAKNPNDKKALFNMGRIYTYSGEYQKAATYFIQGGDLKALNSESAFDYGITFYNLKDYPRSIRGFKRVSGSSSRKDTARFYTGVSYFETSNHLQALINFKKARDIPDELAEWRDNYINYLESHLNPQHKKIHKKRYRKITRSELPPMAGITYKDKTKEKEKEKNAPSIFSFDLTPTLRQSIDYESTEYAEDFYELTSYNYSVGLKTDLTLKVPSTKSTKKTSFTLPVSVNVNSCGAIEIEKGEPTYIVENTTPTTPDLGIDVTKLYSDEDEDKQDLLQSMFQVCYAPTKNDIQSNFSLKATVTPRVDVPLSSLGKLALLYAEYTLTYKMANLTDNTSSMSHKVYAGLDKVGSSIIFAGTKLGLEYEDSSSSELAIQTLYTDSYISLKPLSPLTISLFFDSEHPLNQKEDNSSPSILTAGGSGEYNFELNEINNINLKLEVEIPISGEDPPPPDKESPIINTNLLYSLTHNIIGINLFLAGNNLSSTYKSFVLNPNISVSIASVLIFSIYDDFTYYSAYSYKDTSNEYNFSEGAHTNLAYASIAYTPFSWLKIMTSYLFLYNEFQLPAEVAETFYTTLVPYSTSKITGIIELSYTF